MAHQYRNCPGPTMTPYTGPILEVVFTWTELVQTDTMRKRSILPRKELRTVTRTARLNNPRKSQEGVRLELCRQEKLKNPKAKLKSFRIIRG